jgi:hypothetical protein
MKGQIISAFMVGVIASLVASHIYDAWKAKNP